MSTTPTPLNVTRTDSYAMARDLFHETVNRISHLAVAQRIWHRHFRPDQRNALGPGFKAAISQHGNAFRMWAFVHDVSEQHAVLEVGEALGKLSSADVDFILREAGELPRDPEEAREIAIQRGGLVLTRQPRRVYWEGVLVDVDWNQHSKSWEFLLIAADRGRKGQSIDRLDFGEMAEDDIVTKRKSRLKSTRGFPDSLIARFVIEGKGTQRLDLDRTNVHIFDDGDV